MTKTLAFVSALLLAGTVAAAQPPNNPTVKMSVTLPDGQTKTLTTFESGVATFALSDGTEMGVEPTIMDSKPWRDVVLTFFKMPTSTHATEEVGKVEVTAGGAPASTKGAPVFKAAVAEVTAPLSTVARTH